MKYNSRLSLSLSSLTRVLVNNPLHLFLVARLLNSLWVVHVIYSSISLSQNLTNYFGSSYFCTNCTHRRHIVAHRRVHIIILYTLLPLLLTAVYPAKGLFVTRTRSLVTSRHVCLLSAHDRKCCQNDYCKNMQKSVLSRLNRLRSAWRWHVDTFSILRFHLLVIFTQ